jgi:hypothetical protein
MCLLFQSEMQLKVKIWLSITQYFDEVEFLRTAIEHAGGVHGGVQDKTLPLTEAHQNLVHRQVSPGPG